MHCQICNKNEATIHLTEIVDGMRSEMHICEHCAAEQGIAVKSHIPINELLSSLLAVQPSDDELSESVVREFLNTVNLERMHIETSRDQDAIVFLNDTDGDVVFGNGFLAQPNREICLASCGERFTEHRDWAIAA